MTKKIKTKWWWYEHKSTSGCNFPNSFVVVSPSWLGWFSELLEENLGFQMSNSEESKNHTGKKCSWPLEMVYWEMYYEPVKLKSSEIILHIGCALKKNKKSWRNNNSDSLLVFRGIFSPLNCTVFSGTTKAPKFSCCKFKLQLEDQLYSMVGYIRLRLVVLGSSCFKRCHRTSHHLAV